MSSPAAPHFLSRHSPPHIGTLIGLTGLSALAMNIFLPSLPGMASEFGTTPAVMGLSVGVYLFVNALLQLVIGPVSDKYGRRPVILIGLAVFLLATLGCIWSTDVVMFLSFRMLQASVAVAMVLSRAVVRDTTPGDRAAARIAYVTMGMAVVPMIGPAIGGFLETGFGWRANFWMLFGLGAIIAALVWADLGETLPANENTLWQQFKEYPELLLSPRFWGYCLASAFGAGTFFSFLGGVPFVGAQVFDLDASQIGLYFAAPSIGYFAGNYLSGAYAARIGINRMILWGMLIAIGSTMAALLLHYSGLQTLNSFFLLMVPVGLSNGMVIPNATAGMLSVRPRLAGTASGLGSAIMLSGGAALSALAALSLRGSDSETPLLWIMTLSGMIGAVFILLVIRRERHLGSLGEVD